MPKLAAKLLAKPAAKPVQIGRKIGSLLIAKQPAQPKHAPPMPLARKFNVLKLGLKTKPVKAATPAKPGTWVIVKPVTAPAKPMAGPAVHGQVTKIPAKTSAQPQLVKPALGLLKTQGATAAPGQKVRTQITFVPQGGRISKWLGNFGWITPDKPVPRPEAAKHNGQVFLHKDDLQVEQQPHAGSRVNFCLYVDHSGLGAMNCALAAGAIVAQGKAGNNIGKAGAGKAGAAQGKAGAGKAGAAQGKAAQGKGTSKKATSPLSTQEKPLPPFWEEHWSEEYNMPYFWHSKKQEPSWIRPT
ncbi:unnamed protein product [Effrenium voratum]|nr:unnamed protein product [Effrenium voratum]